MKLTKSILSLAAACCLSATSVFAGDIFYKISKSAVLPSSDTWWDYIKVQSGSSHLYMARVHDGLTVFDVDTFKTIKTIENSTGANGPLLLPEYNRGYIAMTDGSLLSVNLETLETIDRIPLDQKVGLNSGIYDPATKQVYFISGTREQGAMWYILDAASGKPVGTQHFPFSKMDDPATDGKGTLYAPARYDNVILKLNSKTFEELDRWDMPCNVSKVQFQSSTNRLFAACLSFDKASLLLVIDPDTGKEIARAPIGTIMDALVVDEKNKRIITANGGDATLSVIGQKNADEYALLGTVATRPGARMMHIDERTGKLYVVHAESSTTAPTRENPDGDQTYHSDTFTVTEYEPQ